MATTAKELWANIFRFFFATVQAEMIRDINVTDDVLAREALSGLRKHAPKDSPTAKEVFAKCTPSETLEVVGTIAANIRKIASSAVAAALDEDPGASEETIAKGTYVALGTQLPQYAEAIAIPFAIHLAQKYAAKCRRSDKTPKAWQAAFRRKVDAGRWAFRK